MPYFSGHPSVPDTSLAGQEMELVVQKEKDPGKEKLEKKKKKKKGKKDEGKPDGKMIKKNKKKEGKKNKGQGCSIK